MCTNLRGQSLVGAFAQQVLDDAIVVLLRRHVEGREAVETLHVHHCSTLHQNTRHLLLPGCQAKPTEGSVLVSCFRTAGIKPTFNTSILLHNHHASLPLVPSASSYRRENWAEDELFVQWSQGWCSRYQCTCLSCVNLHYVYRKRESKI